MKKLQLRFLQQKFLTALLMLILIASFQPLTADAKVVVGSTCKKVNQKRFVDGQDLVCKKKGKRLVWRKQPIQNSNELANSSPTTAPSPESTSEPLIIRPGAFCSRDQEGKQGVNEAGITYTCKVSDTDTRLRWRQ